MPSSFGKSEAIPLEMKKVVIFFKLLLITQKNHIIFIDKILTGEELWIKIFFHS